MPNSFTEKLFSVFERKWHSTVYYLIDTLDDKPVLLFTLEKTQ